LDQPKPENLVLKATRLDLLLKTSSKILTEESKEESSPSRLLAAVHQVYTQQKWLVKTHIRSLGPDRANWSSQETATIEDMAFGQVPDGETFPAKGILGLVLTALQEAPPAEWHVGEPITDGFKNHVILITRCLIQGQWPDNTPPAIRDLSTGRTVNPTIWREVRSPEEKQAFQIALRERKEAKKAKARSRPQDEPSLEVGDAGRSPASARQRTEGEEERGRETSGGTELDQDVSTMETS
jgi:hypothetical protein